jgi:RNA polymerase sigma-70 factor (ECF subfamily)
MDSNSPPNGAADSSSNGAADEVLMRRVAAGEADFLESLIRRYASPVLTFIDRMIGDRHRSEELFQEVFLAVWKHRGQYQYPRPFRPWLYAIAANKCRELLRSSANRDWPSLDPIDAPEPTTPSAEESAIAGETAGLVAAAVRRLPDQQRAVVVLRVWHGLSYFEIAEILDRSAATVRSHMHHGLIALRKALEPKLV